MDGPKVISGVINRAVLEIRRGRESCVVSELYMAQLFLIVVMKPILDAALWCCCRQMALMQYPNYKKDGRIQ